MTWTSWAIFAATAAFADLTPGPAVLFVLSHGLARGGRASLWANAGILTCNAVYFLLSALGVGAAIASAHRTFTVVKIIGAVYLVYLGVQSERGAGVALSAQLNTLEPISDRRTFTRGVLLQASNPKALLFYVALLPQFINPTRAAMRQLTILGVTDGLIEFAILTGYGQLASTAAALTTRPAFITLTTRLSGAMLVVAGVSIALTA